MKPHVGGTTCHFRVDRRSAKSQTRALWPSRLFVSRCSRQEVCCGGPHATMPAAGVRVLFGLHYRGPSVVVRYLTTFWPSSESGSPTKSLYCFRANFSSNCAD